jgi:hypothetical protein
MKTKIIVVLILITICLFNRKIFGQINNPEINIVYGAKHIFTVETPNNWTNDKESAKEIGLVCFFYPKADSLNKQKSYIYALGIDKSEQNESLDSFIKGDLEKYKMKYPDFKCEVTNLGFTGGVKNGKLYSFSGLIDRYKEEVVYCETELSFIVFSFSATTEINYKDYQPVFDNFINSFKYRGDNPQPFLDYLEKNKQK